MFHDEVTSHVNRASSTSINSSSEPVTKEEEEDSQYAFETYRNLRWKWRNCEKKDQTSLQTPLKSHHSLVQNTVPTRLSQVSYNSVVELPKF